MTEVAERKNRGTSRKTTVHFDLEGAWLANLARNRVEEGCWERALHLLMDSLDGMTHEQAQKLLTGRADLGGWASDKDGLSYKELSDTNPLARRMDEVQARLYGNVFRYGDDYWQPYATVHAWCRDDMTHALNWGRGYLAIGFGGRDERISALRTLYYANDQARDLAVYAEYPSPKGGTNVLCEKVRMPPTWMQLPSSKLRPEQFILELLKTGKTWEARGASGTGLTDDEGLEQRLERRDRAQAEDMLEPAAEKPPAPTKADASVMAAEFIRRLNAADSSADINALGREFDQRFDKMREASKSLAVCDVLQVAEDLAEKRLLESYRRSIVTQADEHGGWLELKVTREDGTPFETEPSTLRVPKNPFLLWSLRGHDFKRHGQVPPQWQSVCPSGMKMLSDDRNHTDWVVGAGLDPQKAYQLDNSSYDSRVQASASSLRYKLTQEWSSAKLVILSRGLEDRYFGDVYLPEPHQTVPAGSIAVVPHAGPEYQLALESASKPGKHGRPGAMICNTGGKLAHLSVVGRELKCTVLMVPGATTRFLSGMSIAINLLDGTLSWIEQ